MKINIAPDFQNLLHEHSPEELAQLEKNVLDDPAHRIMPAVVLWANGPKVNIVIDGHHQLALRKKHGLKVRTVSKTFPDRFAAMQYALGVQFGRRNSNATQRATAYAKMPRFGHGGQERFAADEENGEANAKPQVAPVQLEELARRAGVSPTTMQQAATAVDNCAAQVVRAMERGEVSAKDAAAVSKLPKADQTAALQKFRSGKAATLRAAVPRRRKASKAGQAVTPLKYRAKLQSILGQLVRTFQEAGLLAEVKQHTSALASFVKRIK